MASLAVVFDTCNFRAIELVVNTPSLTLLTTRPRNVPMPRLAGAEVGAHISCGPLAPTTRALQIA